MNDLAMAVKNLSENMDKQFVGVNNKFTKIDRQFIVINDKFAKIDDNFAKINDKFAKIDGQFVEVNNQFKKQEIKLEKMMDDKIEDLALMISKSFEKIATKDEVNLLRNEMNEKFDKVNNSIEKISIHMDNLVDVVYSDHRPRIINLENRTQKLESRI